MTSNSDGKTSASGVMGILTIAVGLLCFAVGTAKFIAFEKDPTVLMYSTALVTTGLGVLGYRKSKDSVVAQNVLETLDSALVKTDKTAAKPVVDVPEEDKPE